MVAVCTGDLLRYTDAARAIGGLHAPDKSCELWKMGGNIADSINQAFETTLADPKYEWCWLMGDDHVFPETILLSLLDRDCDIVVAMCLNRYPPFDPTIIKDRRAKHIESLPDGGLYELGEGETCGDAGLLIRRRVLEAIKPPWYERLRFGSLGVDDQCFIGRLKDAGFTVNYDLDNRMGHMTPFNLLPIKKDTGWEVRLICGHALAADLIPKPGRA